jgi:hypothetical protein
LKKIIPLKINYKGEYIMSVSYKNVTGAKLIVTNELGLMISFAAGETKSSADFSGVTNYLERFTSAYLTAPDILLQRVGNLDGDGIVSQPVIEEENMAVRPSLPNRGTEGVQWGPVGGDRRTGTVWTEKVVAAGYADDTGTGIPGLANNATRLRRVGFVPEFDKIARQIDTRYVGVKFLGDLAGVTLNAGLGSASAQIAALTAIHLDTTNRGFYYVTYTASGASVYSLLLLTDDGVLEVGYDTTANAIEVDFNVWA